MDCRQTLGTGENFAGLLARIQLSNETAYLLVDEGGMERREGRILTLDTKAAEPFVEMETGEKIEIRRIIAVNGIFLPEYGEC